jgi:hypothetical protein
MSGSDRSLSHGTSLSEHYEVRNPYFYFSKVLGHEYSHLTNEVIGADMKVDVQKLTQILQNIV